MFGVFRCGHLTAGQGQAELGGFVADLAVHRQDALFDDAPPPHPLLTGHQLTVDRKVACGEGTINFIYFKKVIKGHIHCFSL